MIALSPQTPRIPLRLPGPGHQAAPQQLLLRPQLILLSRQQQQLKVRDNICKMILKPL